jgi:hypothetical protein
VTVPTPKHWKGRVEPLERRCGDATCATCRTGALVCRNACETWHVTNCSEVQLDSFAPGDVGTNWSHARPLIAAGRNVKDGCFVAPLFSRVTVFVAFIHADPDFPLQTIDVLPGAMHLEVRAGDEGIVSRITGGRAVWTPNGWDDFALVLELTGLLVTRFELWGWVEKARGADNLPLPYRAHFNLAIDRLGGGAPTVWLNADANVAADTT